MSLRANVNITRIALAKTHGETMRNGSHKGGQESIFCLGAVVKAEGGDADAGVSSESRPYFSPRRPTGGARIKPCELLHS